MIKKILNAAKKPVSRILNFIKNRENISLFIAMVIFFLAPFCFLRHPYEFFTLICPMYVNEYGGITVWLAFQKPIWQVSVTIASVCNVTGIPLYLGVDLGKIITSKIGKLIKLILKKLNLLKYLLSPGKVEKINQNTFFRRIAKLTKKVKKILTNFQNKIDWLIQRHIVFAYLLCAVPFIPYIGMALTVFLRVKRIKSGIWILCAIGYLRSFLTVLAIYYGFHWIF